MRIIKSVQYININYYKKITVSELCKISGYSVSHLRRLFMREYGVSPRQYIVRDLLIESAAFVDEGKPLVNELSRERAAMMSKG